MWKYLIVLALGCAACEKPKTQANEQESKPYDQRKNEELKALKVDLEATMDGRTTDVEKAVVESSQE